MKASRFSLIVFFVISVTAYGQSSGPFVCSVWSGNVTPTSATVVARLNAPGLKVRLQISENENLAPAIFSTVVTTAAGSGNTAKLSVQGLKPDTDYYYGIEVGGVVRTEVISRGRLRTFPLGRASFRVAFASCSDFRHADQRSFDAIRQEQPLLFIHMGDMNYKDTNSTVADDYRANYDGVLQNETQSALYRRVPLAYMWDDHDFSGDNSDTNATGRDTARVVYKERVPHYPISVTGGSIGQAFTIGRVRFIMTDLRSASSSPWLKEAASKSRLGTAQKAWFKQELINARDGGFPLIVWVCTLPWIARAEIGDDSWGGHATERTELANFIRENRISNLVLLSGDMHGLAFDDGSNSDYATGGGAPVTVLQAAALTSEPALKGGPFAVGPLPGTQQYGLLEIYDNGGSSVACRFLGTKVGEGRKLTQIFSGSVAGAKEQALVNISTLARVNSSTDAMVTGFVISGSASRRVLVRAVGPTLTAFGVNDALRNPVLSVHQNSQLVATNAAWAGATRAATDELLEVFDRAGAFRFVDEASRDAALVLNLSPGAYSTQVHSGDGAPGSALLEVYDLP